MCVIVGVIVFHDKHACSHCNYVCVCVEHIVCDLYSFGLCVVDLIMTCAGMCVVEFIHCVMCGLCVFDLIVV